jgi:hypothetical protein
MSREALGLCLGADENGDPEDDTAQAEELTPFAMG